MSKLSIIIPVYNNYKYTKNVLNYFAKYNDDFFELIIIDNNSSDQTQEIVLEYLNLNNFKYIRNDTNLGFGGAINKAYNQSSGENILLLNNDIKFLQQDLNWLKDITSNLQDNYLVGPTGGLLDKDHNFVYETEDQNKKINYMSGWFLCATRNTFDKLSKNQNGPFDDKTFFVYFEDADLSFRATRLGMKFKLINVPLVHIGKQTSKLLNVPKLYQESRIKFINKWSKINNIKSWKPRSKKRKK